MDIKEIRKLTGLSAQKFGDKYDIPLRTIQNWEGGVNTPPPYLVKLLERVVKEDFEKGIEALDPNAGKWIDGHCSECGCDIPAYIIDWKWQKDMDARYCPNCGAKMEKSEDKK